MSPARLSKIEAGKRLVLEFNEAFNRHDVPGMMQLMTGDCIFENTAPAPDGTVYSGKEAVSRFRQEFFREAPNAHIGIEEILRSWSALRDALEIHMGRRACPRRGHF